MSRLNTTLLDVGGRPHLDESDAWWHLVAVSGLPVAVVCPNCWPSYQTAVQQYGTRHTIHIARITSAAASGAYVCTQCQGSEVCH